MRAVLFLVTILLFAVSAPIFPCSANTLSLPEAIQKAFRNNHLLQAQKNDVEAGKADIGIARSRMLPSIFIEEKYLRTSNPTYSFMAKLNQERFTASDFAVSSLNNPNAINDFQTSVAFEQPLFVKAAQIGIEMAAKQSEAREKQYLRTKDEISLEIVKAYLQVKTCREFVTVAEKGLTEAKEHERISELRHSNELGLYSDILRAKTAMMEAEQKMVSARKNLDVAQKALGLLLALEEPVDVDSRDINIPLRSLEYYNKTAQERSDVQAMEAYHDNARKNLKLAGASLLPTVGVGGSYQLNDHAAPFGTEGESWQLGAAVTWQLYDGSKRQYEKIKARHRIAESGEYLDGLKKMIAFKVYEAYRTVEETEKNRDLAEAALLTAEEGKRLVQLRYENSLAQLVDLLNVQAALDHARAVVVSRRNNYQLSKAVLSCESGTILQDLGIERKEEKD